MEQIAIGIVRTSFGVRGLIKIKSLSGETDHFLKLKEVSLTNGKDTRSFKVEAVEVHDRDLVMKLKGLESPEEARKYAGWEIRVPRENGSRLSEGDYFISDLIACTVVKDGRRLGNVLAVCEGYQADLLEVETGDGKRYMVPFMDQYVGSVNLERREIELIADWLLE